LAARRSRRIVAPALLSADTTVAGGAPSMTVISVPFTQPKHQLTGTRGDGKPPSGSGRSSVMGWRIGKSVRSSRSSAAQPISHISCPDSDTRDALTASKRGETASFAHQPVGDVLD
jgi:hypothetical protein